MRKLSLSFGLALFALAGSARAQDETPATAPAAEPAAPAAAASAPGSKMQVGIAFLPMFLGSLGTGNTGDDSWADMSPAYGVGLSFDYRVIAGLSVGVAPQFLFHVKAKNASESMMEYDIMARIAYAYNVIPKLAVYAEFLPGYSIVSLPSDVKFMAETPPSPKGLVLAFGGGAAFDITDQFFVNLGIGYQMGWQNTSGGGGQDYKIKFLRIALGGGMKF